MTSQPRSIWYRLVDPSTGLPFMTTSADKVFVSSDADVAECRDAVHAKNRNKLSSFDPSDLVVYKNMEAFEMRKAVEDKQEPIEADYVVYDLGKSTKEALIIAVPSLHLSAWGAPPRFYTIVSRASIKDKFISFEDKILNTGLRKLYIRECYESIASSILNNNISSKTTEDDDVRKVIISGTPGIGKSMFLIYLLHLLLREGKRVLFIYDPDIIYFDDHGRIYYLKTIPPTYDLTFWGNTLWCLFDAKGKTQSDLHRCRYISCNFILSTSPRRDLINDFKKPPCPPKKFFIPVWSEMELSAIAHLFPESTDWARRSEIIGGIPRYVMEDLNEDPIAILSSATFTCSLNDCITLVGLNTPITEKSNIIHSLVHMISEKPFEKYSIRYASPTALKMVAKRNENEVKQNFLNLLSSYEGEPLTAALCGYIFEPYALDRLVKGGQFTWRTCKKKDRKMRKPNNNDLIEIKPSARKTANGIEAHQESNVLYVPNTKNFAGIDAWIPGFGAFQITVGKTHTLNDSVMQGLTLLGKGSNKLYWVLHSYNYDRFSPPEAEGIDQYAVLIDVDMKLLAGESCFQDES